MQQDRYHVHIDVKSLKQFCTVFGVVSDNFVFPHSGNSVIRIFLVALSRSSVVQRVRRNVSVRALSIVLAESSAWNWLPTNLSSLYEQE